jgi:hypothetical protein
MRFTLEQLEKTLTVAGEKGADPLADAIRRLIQLAIAYTDYAAANRRRWRALFVHRLAEDKEVPAWYRQQCSARLSSHRGARCARSHPIWSRVSRILLARSLSRPCHGIVLIGHLRRSCKEHSAPHRARAGDVQWWRRGAGGGGRCGSKPIENARRAQPGISLVVR